MKKVNGFWNRSLVQFLLPLPPYSLFMAYWVLHFHTPVEVDRAVVSVLAGVALGLAMRPRDSEVKKAGDHFCYFTTPAPVSGFVMLSTWVAAALTAAMGLQYLGLSFVVGPLVLSFTIAVFEKQQGLPLYNCR